MTTAEMTPTEREQLTQAIDELRHEVEELRRALRMSGALASAALGEDENDRSIAGAAGRMAE